MNPIRHDADVLIVGTGPAGLSAALAASGAGARVIVLGQEPRMGGQIWRHLETRSLPHAGRRTIARSLAANIDWIPEARVVDAEGSNRYWISSSEGVRCIDTRASVLACGARELILPFPGWTLPGVHGAGGLQALGKSGLSLRDRRVVIAGSGPLLLAAAASLRKSGADLRAVIEHQPAAALRRFAAGLLLHRPRLLLQAASLRAQLAGVPWLRDAEVVRAHGSNALEAITWRRGRMHRLIECEHLGIGYGLVPNLELPELLGCTMQGSGTARYVKVAADQSTSIPGVFAAGEICGIGGVDLARAEGQLAGLRAAGDLSAQPQLSRRIARLRGFSRVLREAFPIHPRVHALAEPDTILCRCEDVRFGDAVSPASQRELRLGRRVGMGWCQGRSCGAILSARHGLDPARVRAPLFPVRVEELACMAEPTAPATLES